MDLQENVSVNASPKSHSTSLTTPDQSPGNDDDVWASDTEMDHPRDNAHHRQQEMLSDLPTIRRQHMTDGYREGLAIGKAQVMQDGFDKGYPIGVAMALRAGKVIGILEGYLASKGIADDKVKSASIQKSLDKAKEQLACSALLKDINDEIIANANDIPDHIERILRRWELLVLGR